MNRDGKFGLRVVQIRRGIKRRRTQNEIIFRLRVVQIRRGIKLQELLVTQCLV